MPVPLQTSIDGRETPVLPGQAPSTQHEQDRLFTAPQTIPGQIAISA